jgi:hypothetical protein
MAKQHRKRFAGENKDQLIRKDRWGMDILSVSSENLIVLLKWAKHVKGPKGIGGTYECRGMVWSRMTENKVEDDSLIIFVVGSSSSVIVKYTTENANVDRK